MPAESPFVKVAKEVASQLLQSQLYVEQGAALLYQLTVDNQLNLTVDLKRPVRGNSAFQTDLCIFEKKGEGICIPRVVMEFKTHITTHDILTYSAKAAKHKQIYPYLRYGIIAEKDTEVPKRLFTHNDSLDFCAAVSGLEENNLSDFFSKLLSDEVKTSILLEDIAFGSIHTRLFRSEVVISEISVESKSMKRRK